MGEEIKAGCARPTGGPVGEKVHTQEEKPSVTVATIVDKGSLRH